MGYDLHITRRADWCDEESRITLDEWLAIVAADPDLRLDGFARAELADGWFVRVDDPSIAVWTAHPDPVQCVVWLAWREAGDVVVKNPDEPTRRKMWQIAQLLSARVQGDASEFYGPDGQIVPSQPE